MKKSYSVLMIFALCAVAITAQAQQGPQAAARQSAKSWLAIVDGGHYAQSWDAASQYLKSSITKDKWTADVGKARAATGALRSRKLASIQYKKGLPNMPSAEYVVAIYDATFRDQPSAAETVFLMRDNDGHWRVAGYLIKPK